MEERDNCVACGDNTTGYCSHCSIFMCYECAVIEQHTGVFICKTCKSDRCRTYLISDDECYQCNVSKSVGELNALSPGLGTAALSALVKVVAEK